MNLMIHKNNSFIFVLQRFALGKGWEPLLYTVQMFPTTLKNNQ
jgi:hypothetical protein